MEGQGKFKIEIESIKPVQRICKYPLLVRELLKYTQKTAPDYPELEKALEMMESLAAKVNEASKAAEKKEKLAALLARIESPIPLPYHDKKLILEGHTLMNKSKERHLTLFKDALLVSKVISKGKYALENVFQMHELVMIKTNVHAESLLRNNSARTTINLQYTVEKREISFAFSEDGFTRWNEAFKSSINDPENVLKRRVEPSSPVSEYGSPSLRETGKSGSGVFKKSGIPNTLGARGTSQIGNKSFTSVDSSNSLSGFGSNTSQSELDSEVYYHLPEAVEIDGELWKRTFSAKNVPYYFNTVSRDVIWKLPHGYVTVDLDQLASKKHFSSDSGHSGVEGAGDVELEVVPGSPSWRRVTKGGYYFNVGTQETSWTAPPAP
ncbi:hypothetical protein HDU98_012344 [Podochytrium sp. JEL0797]|nr:hypothetical protein HDU98_012344 [Podochytrium sp. JEL0797]